MPRPFHFTLEKILEYREQLEEQALMELAKAQTAYQKQVDHVTALRQKLAEHESGVYSSSAQPGGAPSSADMWLWRNYRERLMHDLELGEMKMLELAKEVNRRRRDAVARSKDRKLLEKLKEKKAQRHAEEDSKKEQNEFDEMATIRYKHRSF